MLDSDYYEASHVLGYEPNILCVCDFRGYGKTTNLTKKLFNGAIKTHKCYFMYFRRTRGELDDLKSTGNFGKDIETLFPKVMKGYTTSLVGNNVIFTKFVNGEKVDSFRGGILAYYDQFKAKKGIQYPTIDVIYCDEVFPEDGKFQRGEWNKIMNICDSVFRDRPIKLWLSGNPITVDNPIFNAFGITKAPTEGITKITKGGRRIIIEYGSSRDSKALERRKGSDISALTKGTDYDEYATNIKFKLDDNSDVGKMPKGKGYQMSNICANGRLIQVRYINGIYYFSDGKDKSRKTFSPYLDDAKSGNAIFVDGKSAFLKGVSKAVADSRAMFSTQSVKNEIILIARKIMRGF